MTDDAREFDHSVLGTREHLSLGLDTFGDAPLDGAPANHAQTLREVVAEAVLADRVGVEPGARGELLAGGGQQDLVGGDLFGLR